MVDKNNRFQILDSLRGVAAVSVMLFHYMTAFQVEFGYSKPPLLDFRYGFYGVQLFFTISGFVIYFSISNTKNVIDFLIKRFIRLFPCYWLCLVITFAAVSYFGISAERDTTLREAIVNLTMMQSVFHTKSVDTSYWSLEVELYFYFFMAFLFITKLNRYMNWVLVIWLGWIIYYNFVYKVPYAGLLLGLHYAMFFIGGIGFYKIKVLKEDNFFSHFIIIASYITSLAVLKDMDGHIWGVTGVYVIFYLAMYDVLFFLKNKFLYFLGNISYPLYLIHFHIGIIILKHLKAIGLSHPLIAIIPMAFSVLLAWIITNYYDAYVSKWLRNKLNYQKIVARFA